MLECRLVHGDNDDDDNDNDDDDDDDDDGGGGGDDDDDDDDLALTPYSSLLLFRGEAEEEPVLDVFADGIDEVGRLS